MRYVILVLVLLAIAVGIAYTCLLSIRYPDDGNDDYARMAAMSLYEAAKAWGDKHENAELKDIDDLVPYLDKGEAGLLDPWGQKYQFKTAEDRHGRTQFVFWTTNPKTGKVVGWPRELAEGKK